jgi:transposase
MCEVAGDAVVERRTVSSLQGVADVLGPGCAPARVAIEACREAWHVHGVLTSWGNEVLLVDTTRVKQLGIGQHGRKTDRIDAEVLARGVERGAIPCAHLLSPMRQQLRLDMSVRHALVETRSQYVTTVRGLARPRGDRLPTCEVERFVGHVRRTKLADTTRALVLPLLDVIDAVGQ